MHGQLDFVAVDSLPPAQPIVGNGYLTPVAADCWPQARPTNTAPGARRATELNLRSHAGGSSTGADPFEWRFRARGTADHQFRPQRHRGPLFDADGTSLAPLYVSTGHGSMGNVSEPFRWRADRRRRSAGMRHR